MTDQPAPPAASYPGFEITADGLGDVHRELGRLYHQAAEKDRRMGKILEVAQQLQAEHAPGHCQPITPTPTIDEIMAQANGTVSADDVTPIGSRRKGG